MREAGLLLTPAQYDEAVNERGTAKLCGYPMCTARLPQEPSEMRKYVAAAQTRLVYDMRDRNRFCCTGCHTANKAFAAQLSEVPIYKRPSTGWSTFEVRYVGPPGDSSVSKKPPKAVPLGPEAPTSFGHSPAHEALRRDLESLGDPDAAPDDGDDAAASLVGEVLEKTEPKLPKAPEAASLDASAIEGHSSVPPVRGRARVFVKHNKADGAAAPKVAASDSAPAPRRGGAKGVRFAEVSDVREFKGSSAPREVSEAPSRGGAEETKGEEEPTEPRRASPARRGRTVPKELPWEVAVARQWFAPDELARARAAKVEKEVKRRKPRRRAAAKSSSGGAGLGMLSARERTQPKASASAKREAAPEHVSLSTGRAVKEIAGSAALRVRHAKSAPTPTLARPLDESATAELAPPAVPSARSEGGGELEAKLEGEIVGAFAASSFDADVDPTQLPVEELVAALDEKTAAVGAGAVPGRHDSDDEFDYDTSSDDGEDGFGLWLNEPVDGEAPPDEPSRAAAPPPPAARGAPKGKVQAKARASVVPPAHTGVADPKVARMFGLSPFGVLLGLLTGWVGEEARRYVQHLSDDAEDSGTAGAAGEGGVRYGGPDEEGDDDEGEESARRFAAGPGVEASDRQGALYGMLERQVGAVAAACEGGRAVAAQPAFAGRLVRLVHLCDVRSAVPGLATAQWHVALSVLQCALDTHATRAGGARRPSAWLPVATAAGFSANQFVDMVESVFPPADEAAAAPDSAAAAHGAAPKPVRYKVREPAGGWGAARRKRGDETREQRREREAREVKAALEIAEVARRERDAKRKAAEDAPAAP